jgi:hypothetical protein
MWGIRSRPANRARISVSRRSNAGSLAGPGDAGDPVPERLVVGRVVEQPAVAEVADLAADQGVGARLVPGQPADVGRRRIDGPSPFAGSGQLRPVGNHARTIPARNRFDGTGVRCCNCPTAPAPPRRRSPFGGSPHATTRPVARAGRGPDPGRLFERRLVGSGRVDRGLDRAVHGRRRRVGAGRRWRPRLRRGALPAPRPRRP